MRLIALFILAAGWVGCSVDHGGLLGFDAAGLCETAADCNDGMPCTTDRCEGGMCVHEGCPDGTMCHDGECMTVATCDSTVCAEEGSNPNTCSVGECQGDLCVSVSTCGDGETCCGGACQRCESDDPCMEGVCGSDGMCTLVPKDAGTSCYQNGNFCEGAGTCDGAGACTNLQFCGQECDEVNDRCVGCLGDDDCVPLVEEPDCGALIAPDRICHAVGQRITTPFSCISNECVAQPPVQTPVDCRRPEGSACDSVTVSPYGACDYGGSVCAETGTRTRTRTTPVCRGDSCANEQTTESDTCRRDRDGISCGTPTEGPWSDCGGFGNVCDSTGTQSRTIMTPTCAGGGCGSVNTTETAMCTRPTEGMECMPNSFSAWSACTRTDVGNVCSRAGTRTRTRTEFDCAADACTGTPFTETQNCTLPATGGDSCGTPTVGPWGACSFADMCSEMGTRSRTVTTPVCRSQMCRMEDSTETEACTRDTDGTMCGATTTGAWSACGGFISECDEDGTRSRTVTMRSCQAGSCAAMDTVESEECRRMTDGLSCGAAPVCSNSGPGADANPCVGSMSTQICNSGTCGPGAVSPCDMPAATNCDDPSVCSTGTCDGAGTCNVSSTCASMNACMPSCSVGECCDCDGAGTCGCM